MGRESNSQTTGYSLEGARNRLRAGASLLVLRSAANWQMRLNPVSGCDQRLRILVTRTHSGLLPLRRLFVYKRHGQNRHAGCFAQLCSSITPHSNNTRKPQASSRRQSTRSCAEPHYTGVSVGW